MEEIPINLISQSVEKVNHDEFTNDRPKIEIIKKTKVSTQSESTILRSENPKCPKCGSGTILKDGKFGKFYGCTRYNETGCNGIVNIKNIPVNEESGKDLAKIIIDFVLANNQCKIKDLIPIIKEKTKITRNVSNIESYIKDYLSDTLELEKIDSSKGVKKRDKGIFG